MVAASAIDAAVLAYEPIAPGPKLAPLITPRGSPAAPRGATGLLLVARM